MSILQLEELEDSPSFALLAPGFSSASEDWTLISPLSAEEKGPLVFLPFEGRAPGEVQRYAGPRRRIAELRPCRADALSYHLEAPRYAEHIAQLREDIARGEVYQVCYTVRAKLPGHCSGGALLSRMGQRGWPRFAAWIRFPDGSELVSASPELFFEYRGRWIHSQPMKGTARLDRAGALQASEKDEAELAMITDLIRNDLTPLCEPRSVEVTAARRVLELSYALQTVSEVEGRLREGVGLTQMLEALHPGGSVTGAPKNAALERIAALESSPRQAYCASLGLAEQERGVFAMLIRTAWKAGGDWVYGVGGGIVYDSSAESEYDELVLKLGALGGEA